MPCNALELGAPTRARRAIHVFLTLCLGCCNVVQSASAEVRISGTSNDLIVETRGASLAEVLQALKIQSRGSVGASSPINGVYSGSLERLLPRLLDGHNFVVRRSGAGLEVRFFDPGGAAPSIQAAAPAKAAPGAQDATGPLKLCEYNGVPIEC